MLCATAATQQRGCKRGARLYAAFCRAVSAVAMAARIRTHAAVQFSISPVLFLSGQTRSRKISHARTRVIEFINQHCSRWRRNYTPIHSELQILESIVYSLFVNGTGRAKHFLNPIASDAEITFHLFVSVSLIANLRSFFI